MTVQYIFRTITCLLGAYAAGWILTFPGRIFAHVAVRVFQRSGDSFVINHIGSIVVFITSIALAPIARNALLRIVLRAYPIRDDRRRAPTFWILHAASCVTIVSQIALIFADNRRLSWGGWFAIGVNIWIWHQAAEIAGQLHQSGGAAPFAVFLRRFGSFADRSLLAGVLQALGTNLWLAVLVDPKGSGGTFDPFVIAFSGLGRRPNGSCFQQADYSDWEEPISRLIASAGLIVFDATNWSKSLQLEADLITRANAWSKVVVLLKRDAKTPKHVRRGRIVYYETSWLRAVPRVLFGLPATAMAVGLPLALLVTITVPQVAFLSVALAVFSAWILLFIRPVASQASVIRMRAAFEETRVA